MSTADTAWILTATALVLMMTLPGLALFYGGLVRARNVLSVFMQCFAIAAVMSVLWALIGYSIAFGDGGALWGGLGRIGLSGLAPASAEAPLPEILFAAFQMTFAIITPALIVGAVVERIQFAFLIAFSAAWMLLCYAPVAHWVWGGGLLADGGIFGAIGTRDFAGGIVVHETAGLAALVLAVMLGGRRARKVPPHQPGMVFLGAGLLWVGWFGFNGGSQLAADEGAARAVLVTHLSAAAATISWAVWERIRFGRFSLIGALTGAIAGLASITPASGFVGPMAALAIGTIAGVLCHEAVIVIRDKLKIDDTLDVFAVHGVGGIFGTLMIAALGHGSWIAQVGGLIVVGVWTLLISWALARLIGLVLPMRVSQEEEADGLDLSTHGERAYELTA